MFQIFAVLFLRKAFSAKFEFLVWFSGNTINRIFFYFGTVHYNGQLQGNTDAFFDILNILSETVKNVEKWPNVLDIFTICDVIANNFFSNFFFEKSISNTPDITFIYMYTEIYISTSSSFFKKPP